MQSSPYPFGEKKKETWSEVSEKQVTNIELQIINIQNKKENGFKLSAGHPDRSDVG